MNLNLRQGSGPELIAHINDWLQKDLDQQVTENLLLPAGKTPIELYQNWESVKPSFLKNYRFQQLDDVLTGSQAGLFKKFFQQHLPSYQNQFQDLSADAVKTDRALLGVGTNGHLAFHEPGISFNFNYGCIKLSTETCQNLKLEESTWGLSYGAGHFMKCSSVLIIATGEHKKTIVEKSLAEAEPSTPFSFLLKNHIDCTFITDLDI